MKVTWQPDDVKAGVEVARGTGGAGYSIIIFQFMQEGPRYCVYTQVNHTASIPMTKEGLAAYLNENSFQPAILFKSC